MNPMGKMICAADPPPCLADSMAPLASLATTTVSIAHVMSVQSSERRRHSPHQDALKAHRAFVRGTLAIPHARWMRTMNDLVHLQAGDLGVLFGIQYAPNGLTEIAVGEWRAAKLQSMAPFASTSEYGDGAEGKDNGLTERGRQLVEWMSAHRLMLDLSGAGHQTAREVLAFVRQKKLPTHVMASHSGCHAVFPHPRNLPDDVLRGIADLGGYIGIPALASLLAKSNGDDFFRALARHLSYASTVCGSDAIGVGSSISVDFRVLERRLNRFCPPSAVEGYLGRNFEFFLLSSLP